MMRWTLLQYHSLPPQYSPYANVRYATARVATVAPLILTTFIGQATRKRMHADLRIVPDTTRQFLENRLGWERQSVLLMQQRLLGVSPFMLPVFQLEPLPRKWGNRQ
ncbi:MAG: hypothetical protein ACXWIN_09255 [Burkholderiaceae bacterium]